MSINAGNVADTVYLEDGTVSAKSATEIFAGSCKKLGGSL